jgi:hypothetical protein
LSSWVFPLLMTFDSRESLTLGLMIVYVKFTSINLCMSILELIHLG